SSLLSQHPYSHFFILSSMTPAPPALYTLSLHDALPIFPIGSDPRVKLPFLANLDHHTSEIVRGASAALIVRVAGAGISFALNVRSEEHTSELQSRFDLVCRLLLEKKKKSNNDGTRILSQ